MALTPFVTAKKAFFTTDDGVVSVDELLDFLCTKRDCFEEISINSHMTNIDEICQVLSTKMAI